PPVAERRAAQRPVDRIDRAQNRVVGGLQPETGQHREWNGEQIRISMAIGTAQLVGESDLAPDHWPLVGVLALGVSARMSLAAGLPPRGSVDFGVERRARRLGAW